MIAFEVGCGWMDRAAGADSGVFLSLLAVGGTKLSDFVAVVEIFELIGAAVDVKGIVSSTRADGSGCLPD